MSKVKIQANASGTGVFTVTSPATNTDRTITLPDGTGTLLNSDGDGSSLTNLPAGGVDGITSASSSGTAINIASDNDVGVRGAPDAGTTLQVNSGSGENGLHLKQIGNSGGAFAKFVRVSSGDTSNGHWELHHESKNLTIKTNAAAGSVSSPTLTDVFKVCQDGRGLSQFTAKAWVNINQIGTQSIGDSHNVSSISDVNVGRTAVNFANNMANNNYASVTGSEANSLHGTTTHSTSVVHIYINNTGHAYEDRDDVSLVVFGD